MSKKLICAMLLIATLLAACAGSASPTPVGKRPVTTDAEADTIILRFAIFSWNQGQYDGLIQAFEAANPDVRIKTVSIEQTLGDDVKAETWPADAFVWLASAADVIALPFNRDAVLQNALLN